jgi:hypothetical protein
MITSGNRPVLAGPAFLLLALLASAGCATEPLSADDARDARLEQIASLKQELEQERRSRADAEQHAGELESQLAQIQERVHGLQREQERLRADLVDAELTLVLVESGLEAHRSRADAVSLLADARIVLGRAERAAPWRESILTEAREQLRSAEDQLEAGHIGAAVFFTTRARRIADNVLRETDDFIGAEGVLAVRTARANLRQGPSMNYRVLRVLEEDTPLLPRTHSGNWVQVLTPQGDLGWIYGELVSPGHPGLEE